MTRLSDRLGRLPSYAVNELALIKRRLLADGVDVIDLSAGDADIPPPGAAVRALQDAIADPRMSRYPFQVGLNEFREAAARYMEKRFGVRVDPMTDILPLIGSKEGLAHFPLAVINPGQVCVIPDPGYPAYIGGAVLADVEAECFPLRAENGFLVELEELPAERLARVRLVYLNRAVRALASAGFPVAAPKATIYIWVALPGGVSSEVFTRDALEREGVMVLPGTTFGAGGEGYFRIALTAQPERLEEAAQRVGRTMERLGAAGARS